MKLHKSKWLFTVVALLFLLGLGCPSVGWSEYSILHNFAGPPADGKTPRSSLVQDSTYFYGVTEKGGSTDAYCGPDGCGVIFKVKKDGSDYTILHSFRDGTVLNDGAFPVGGLVLSGSTLFGTTSSGGNGVEQAQGTIFRINTDGSDYAILHTFGGYRDDGYGNYTPYECGPNGRLTLCGSTLYGMTPMGGGKYNAGVIFKINTDGTGYNILHYFRDDTVYDGFLPQFSHLTLSGSTLYGMTNWGG